MKHLIALISLALIAACGADGEPITPTMATNIGIGTGGVSASTGVTLQKGPVSVGVGTSL